MDGGGHPPRVFMAIAGLFILILLYCLDVSPALPSFMLYEAQYAKKASDPAVKRDPLGASPAPSSLVSDHSANILESSSPVQTQELVSGSISLKSFPRLEKGRCQAAGPRMPLAVLVCSSAWSTCPSSPPSHVKDAWVSAGYVVMTAPFDSLPMILISQAPCHPSVAIITMGEGDKKWVVPGIRGRLSLPLNRMTLLPHLRPSSHRHPSDATITHFLSGPLLLPRPDDVNAIQLSVRPAIPAIQIHVCAGVLLSAPLLLLSDTHPLVVTGLDVMRMEVDVDGYITGKNLRSSHNIDGLGRDVIFSTLPHLDSDLLWLLPAYTPSLLLPLMTGDGRNQERIEIVLLVGSFLRSLGTALGYSATFLPPSRLCGVRSNGTWSDEASRVWGGDGENEWRPYLGINDTRSLHLAANTSPTARAEAVLAFVSCLRGVNYTSDDSGVENGDDALIEKAIASCIASTSPFTAWSPPPHLGTAPSDLLGVWLGGVSRGVGGAIFLETLSLSDQALQYGNRDEAMTGCRFPANASPSRAPHRPSTKSEPVTGPLRYNAPIINQCHHDSWVGFPVPPWTDGVCSPPDSPLNDIIDLRKETMDECLSLDSLDDDDPVSKSGEKSIPPFSTLIPPPGGECAPSHERHRDAPLLWDPDTAPRPLRVLPRGVCSSPHEISSSILSEEWANRIWDETVAPPPFSDLFDPGTGNYTVDGLPWPAGVLYDVVGRLLGSCGLPSPPRYDGRLWPRGVVTISGPITYARHDFFSSPLVRDVVMVLNYNLFRREFLPGLRILRRMYQLAFPLVVAYGDACHFARPNPTHNLYQCDASGSSPGIYGQGCYGKALDDWQGRAGYIISNDDSIVNWWNLIHHPLDREWISDVGLTRNYTDKEEARNKRGGYAMVGADGYLTPAQKEMQLNNTKRVFGMSSGTIDTVYASWKIVDDFSGLAQLLTPRGGFPVYVEDAIPTIFDLLSRRRGDRVQFARQYLWGPERSRLTEYYNWQAEWVHPGKLSYPAVHDFLIRGFAAAMEKLHETPPPLAMPPPPAKP